MQIVKGHERGMQMTTDDSYELSVCELKSGEERGGKNGKGVQEGGANNKGAQEGDANNNRQFIRIVCG